MSKKKILLIVVILFMCFLSFVSIVAAALLFRQTQINNSEIKSLKDQIEVLNQDRESDAKDNDSSSSSSPITPPAKPETTPSDPGSGTQLSKIHFSKIPQSDSDFSFTVSANKEVSILEPVETSINQIITGPTAAESADGVRNPIILTGTSNCGGSNFTTSTTYDFTTRETDTTIQFCKDLPTGVGNIAKIKTVIIKTLEDLQDSVEFNLGSLAILDKNGNCLGDESGMNLCLE